MKILYIATNFTAITHTFITREVNQLQQAGHEVDLLSVRTHNKQEGVIDPECDLSRSRRIYPVSAFQVAKGVIGALITSPVRLAAAMGIIFSASLDTPKTKLKMAYQLAVATVYAAGIKDEKYDRIHSHFASSPTTFALFFHVLTGTPFSFTGHAADIFREPSAMKAKLERAAGVVAISGYNHDYYETIVPGLVTSRIHCGIDPETYVFRQRDKPNSPLRILAVGRSVPKKGFSYLLDALKILSDAGVEWKCDIVGGGPLEDDLREQGLRLQLDDLNLQGPLQQDRVRELIDEADVFVLPCVVTADGDRDNIPVSLMEAMAAGCPVISTDVAGIPELLGPDGQFGMTVEQRNPQAIADAILQLNANHDLFANLSRQGRLQVEDDFNVRKSAQQLLQFFAVDTHRPKVRICYVLNSFAMGGAETVALDLARRHDAERFEVEVVAPLEAQGEEVSAMHRRFLTAGVKTTVIRQNNFRSPLALFRFFAFLRKGNFDIIHGHNRGTDYWAVKLGQLAGVKHRFWTRHLTYQDMTPRQLDKYQSIAGITDKILAVSEAVAKACVNTEGLPADKVVTVVNGIDMQKFCPLDPHEKQSIRESVGINSGERVLLFVGRFSEQKAPEAFVELVQQLRIQDPTIRGLMCGHGPLEQTVRSRAAAGEGVEVLGLRSDIPDLLGACDLFVSTSRNEGLPLNVMEAMSAGAAFVGPDIPQVRELVAGEPVLEAQLFAPPPAQGPVADEVITNWVELVRECLSDPARLVQVGQVGRGVIGEKFSLELMVERYEAIFEEALVGSR